MSKENKPYQPKEFIEGKHYTMENGLMVFTALYHKDRGYCCKNKCRNCPYKKKKELLNK